MCLRVPDTCGVKIPCYLLKVKLKIHLMGLPGWGWGGPLDDEQPSGDHARNHANER